jgi:hypothetical protein
MKPYGISSDDGEVFICDQCNVDATEFVAIQNNFCSSPESPDGE